MHLRRGSRLTICRLLVTVLLRSGLDSVRVQGRIASSIVVVGAIGLILTPVLALVSILALVLALVSVLALVLALVSTKFATSSAELSSIEGASKGSSPVDNRGV